MVPHASAIPAPATGRRLPSVSFGPYLLLEAAPWLLLATATRMRARHSDGLLTLPLIVLVQFAVLIALLIASQRMIAMAGGTTGLGRLSFREEAALARGVLGRLFLLFLAVILLLTGLGVDRYLCASLWLGLDGIVFDWGRDMLQVWSGVVALIVFLMIVEKGAGRPPHLGPALRQAIRRWPALAKAVLAVIVVLIACNKVQDILGSLVNPAYQQMVPMLRNLLSLGVLFAFAHLRLWATVAILTYALRASYRSEAPG